MKGGQGKRWQTRAPHVGSWYYFSIRRSAEGDVDARVWERDKPENTIEFHENLGPEWGTLPLIFLTDFKGVPFLLDEYQFLK
jgi:hypothetical protein